jgi:hypothetical protein
MTPSYSWNFSDVKAPSPLAPVRPAHVAYRNRGVRPDIQLASRHSYFVIMRLRGEVGGGGPGEIANVSQTLNPSGRSFAPNSL